jgi:GDP-L-fucose synthase
LETSERIFVAGHLGMVGRAILSNLESKGFKNLIIANKSELDLTNQSQVNNFFSSQAVDQVYIAAAKVGGIYANSSYPGQFIYQNLMIQSNLINAAHKFNVKKLLFLGSSCIYPVNASQPMHENKLLSGPLEETNQAYSVAKISGIEMCKSYNIEYGTDFRCVMPTNLYGSNDNFHQENSHVIPALISKFYNAKISNAHQVTIWGSGKPLREFLHVEDLAEACVFIMSQSKKNFLNSLQFSSPHINIGSGNEISINELVNILTKISGFSGNIIFDKSKPDGAMRKLLDCSAIKGLGWSPNISIEQGLKSTYKWFENNQKNIRDSY